MVTRDGEHERRRQQIIDGALVVFAEKGFEKATNQDIAEAAGIGSPGLIYHYFESKADLLHQAVVSRSPELQSVLADEVLAALAPREALSHIGSAFLSLVNDPENQQLFRVILTEAMRNSETAAAWRHATSVPVRQALVRYLAAKMDSSQLRPVDPEAAAHCFLGAFMSYVLRREVFGRTDSRQLSSEMMIATVIDIFMQGLEVE